MTVTPIIPSFAFAKANMVLITKTRAIVSLILAVLTSQTLRAVHSAGLSPAASSPSPDYLPVSCLILPAETLGLVPAAAPDPTPAGREYQQQHTL